MTKFEEGDIIRLQPGNIVHTRAPAHLFNEEDMTADWRLMRGVAVVNGVFNYLAREYVVTHVEKVDGFPRDRFDICCETIKGPKIKVEFRVSELTNPENNSITKVGKAMRVWVRIGGEDE